MQCCLESMDDSRVMHIVRTTKHRIQDLDPQVYFSFPLCEKGGSRALTGLRHLYIMRYYMYVIIREMTLC